MVVEPPVANPFANCQHFRRAPRVGEIHHHAVKVGQVLGDDVPTIIFASHFQQWPIAVDQQRSGTELDSMPDDLALDLRIEREGGRGGLYWEGLKSMADDHFYTSCHPETLLLPEGSRNLR